MALQAGYAQDYGLGYDEYGWPIQPPSDGESDERRRILELFQQVAGFYDSDPWAKLLQGQIQDRASGKSRPFDQNVLAGLLSQNADSAAGAYGAERDMIRSAMANAGLSGSGFETSALLSAMRRQGQQVRTGRRDITTRAQLENFGATERAQAQALQYLQAKAGQSTIGKTGEAGYLASVERQQPPGGKLIPGGNAFGPAPLPIPNVFSGGSYDRMLQQMDFENQDYFGRAHGDPNWGKSVPGHFSDQDPMFTGSAQKTGFQDGSQDIAKTMLKQLGLE